MKRSEGPPVLVAEHCVALHPLGRSLSSPTLHYAQRY